MTKSNPKISIILPSLNVKNYISECIESVINQTLHDIELICVDAGSIDGTLEILEAYKEKDSRIKLLHSNKKSYGYQMNLGINNAKGEYIGIVETDDFIDNKMYETLYELTDNGTTDISKVNFYHYYDYDPVFPEFRADCTKKDLPKDKFTVFDNADILNGHPSIWSAIYKKSFLIENNIKFMEVPAGGWVDNPFFFKTMLSAKSITYLDQAFYYYRELNPTSSTNDLQDLTIPMERMLDNLNVLEEYGCYDENILTALYVRIFWHVRDILKRDNFHEQKNHIIKHMHDVFIKMDDNIIKKRFTLKDQKIFYKYLSPLCLKEYNDEDNISGSDLKNIYLENQFLYSQINFFNKKNRKLKQKNKKLSSKNKRLKTKVKKLNKKIKNIKDSQAYKLGYLALSPYHKLKNINMKNENKNISTFKKDNIHVLFISSDNNKTSGAFLSMVNLMVNLRNKFNIDVFVILPEEHHGLNILVEQNINYKVIPSKNWVVPLSHEKNQEFYNEINKKKEFNKKAIKSIGDFIKSNKVDILHINTTYSYVGAKAAIDENIPFVWHLREFLEEDQSNTLWDRRGNELINSANKIIAVSNSIYEKYEDIFDKDKLIRIYDGIDKNKFYKPNKTIFNDEKIKFIMVGGFENYKGQIEFAEACSILYSNGFKDFEVWFIGTGRKDVRNNVEEIFKSANMNNVRFLGYKKNVEDYFNESDISFTCAKSEAFGRTTVEAMLSGNLVIGADNAGTRELIEDGKSGILYKQGDSYDLYEKMMWAIKNREIVKDIADNGRKFMVENMTAEINADNIYKVYKEILKK